MTLRVLLALGVLALAPAQAVAQEGGGNPEVRGERARLDDFALPEASRETGVQQLSGAREREPEAQPRDRSLTVPALPASPDRALPQLGAPDGARAVVQLDPEARRSADAAPPLSTRGDGRPQGVVVLSGADRCDRQSREADEIERCRRILELRAAEFSASQAPVLSAEQSLLADQQRRENTLGAATRAGLSVRMAGLDADADDRSNQELAAIVLGSAVEPAPAPREPEPVPAEASLAEVLQGLIVQQGGSP